MARSCRRLALSPGSKSGSLRPGMFMAVGSSKVPLVSTLPERHGNS